MAASEQPTLSVPLAFERAKRPTPAKRSMFDPKWLWNLHEHKRASLGNHFINFQ